MMRKIAAAVLCIIALNVPLKAQEAWPIQLAAISSLPKLAKVAPVESPGTSQPEGFDPAKYKTDSALKVIDTFQSKTETKLASGMVVSSYYFDNDDDASYVLEVKDGAKRHALYTHVLNYRLNPATNLLMLDNMLQQPGGKWQRTMRVIDITSKKFTALPDLECTQFFAPDPVNGVITYGQGKQDGDSFGPPRTLCIWDSQGQLQTAFVAPIQNAMANTEETPNGLGLLPADPSTLFLLGYDNGKCVMRLQDVNDATKHRAIIMPAALVADDQKDLVKGGTYGDPCENNISIQVDISKLKLSGGEIRQRVSKSGRADLSEDWNAWQTYQ